MNQQIYTLLTFTGVQATFIYDNSGNNLFSKSSVDENSPIIRSAQNLSKSVANSKKRGHKVKDVHLKLGKNQILARGLENGYIIIIIDKNISIDLFEAAYQQAVPEINKAIAQGDLSSLTEMKEPIQQAPTPKIETAPQPAPQEKIEKAIEPEEEPTTSEYEIEWYNFTLALDNVFTAEEGKIGINKDIISKWSKEYSIRKLHEVEIKLPNGEHIRMEISKRERLKKEQTRLAPSDAKKYGLKAGDTIGIHPLLV